MNLTPDISRKSLIALVFVHFSLSFLVICKILVNMLNQRDDVLFKVSVIITVSYSQTASVILFQSISSQLPPKKKKKKDTN